MFAAIAIVFASNALGAQVACADCDSAWRWVYAPGIYQYTYGGGVVADGSGAYIAGSYDRGFYGDGPDPHWGETLLPLRGEVNFFIARHGANGALRWVRRFGDAGRISADAIAQGPDRSLYVVGTLWPEIGNSGPARWTIGTQTLIASTHAAFLARFDSMGVVQWGRIIDGVANVTEVVVDRIGRIYVAGSTGLPAVIGNPGHAYVAAYTPSGKRSWFRTVAGGRESYTEGIALTPYGVCAVGYVHTPSDDAGKPAVAGLRRTAHAFAVGLSRTGERLWRHEPFARYPAGERRRFPSQDSPQSLSVIFYAAAADKAGSCYVGGGFSGVLEFASDVLTSHRDPEYLASPGGMTDAMVLKYDIRGKPQWGRRGTGGRNSDYVESIAVTPEARVIVAGHFMGVGNFGKFQLSLPSPPPRPASDRLILAPRGLFAATLSRDGEILRALQNVPEENTRPTGISITRDGEVYITGTQERSAVYGHIKAPNLGINAFLARLSGL